MIKAGITAFDVQTADLGKENELVDAEAILCMSTEEAAVSQEQRQALQAKKRADIEHERKLAEIKR